MKYSTLYSTTILIIYDHIRMCKLFCLGVSKRTYDTLYMGMA